jgi:uncharacterized metal-binding protein
MMLVYSCSGASNVAQLANHIAVRLDRSAIMQMSCIAGVGGDVRSLVRTATSGRPVVAIDGCPLACAERTLAAKGVTPARVIRLHEHGLRKRHHTDFTDAEREQTLREILAELAPLLIEEDPELASKIQELLTPAAGA